VQKEKKRTQTFLIFRIFDLNMVVVVSSKRQSIILLLIAFCVAVYFSQLQQERARET
jgi:hypothetical protein